MSTIKQKTQAWAKPILARLKDEDAEYPVGSQEP